MGNENAKAPPPGAFLFALCWEWKDNSPIALLLSTPVSCLPLPTSIFRIFIGACIISSQDLNTNRVIGSPVKKEWKICHFIISSSFMLCNVATVPPLSSLGHLQKKTKRKKTSLQLIDICCAMAQLYHPYIESLSRDLHCSLDPALTTWISIQNMFPISPVQSSFNLGSTSPTDLSSGSGSLFLPPQASV